jgi:hypothetical protein
MGRCPSCQHEVAVLYYSFGAPVLLRNLFRSPAGKIYVCKHCGENLTMTTSSFIFCQVAFIVIVVPCAIGFARLQTWLIHSSASLHQLSTDSPNSAVVFLWILPTLIVTLFIYTAFAKRFVDFEKAG